MIGLGILASMGGIIQMYYAGRNTWYLYVNHRYPEFQGFRIRCLGYLRFRDFFFLTVYGT